MVWGSCCCPLSSAPHSSCGTLLSEIFFSSPPHRLPQERRPPWSGSDRVACGSKWRAIVERRTLAGWLSPSSCLSCCLLVGRETTKSPLHPTHHPLAPCLPPSPSCKTASDFAQKGFRSLDASGSAPQLLHFHTRSGNPAQFDISSAACLPFGFRHGETILVCPMDEHPLLLFLST